jgi:hypothetical protein
VVKLELHVPPAMSLLNAVVDPAQTTAVPVIKDGSGFTVTTTVAEALPQLLVVV